MVQRSSVSRRLTRNVLPPTVIIPIRSASVVFASAVKYTRPFPVGPDANEVPRVGVTLVILSHVLLLATVHVQLAYPNSRMHSRCPSIASFINARVSSNVGAAPIHPGLGS